MKLCLAAHPEGQGGREIAELIEAAGRCAPAVSELVLIRAVERAVGAGAAASEQGDHGRRAAWLRVRATGATV